MNNQRRKVLKTGTGAAVLGALAAAGIINPGIALADWNKAAFEAKSMADTLKALGAGTPAESKDVQVTGPDIAENGAVVPVGVTSSLADRLRAAVDDNVRLETEQELALYESPPYANRYSRSRRLPKSFHNSFSHHRKGLESSPQCRRNRGCGTSNPYDHRPCRYGQ